MGRDGWFTLLLSTLFIVLCGGITLLWQVLVVWRYARTSPALLDGQIALALIPGVKLEGDRPNLDYALRLQRAYALHREHDTALLLLGGYTGGCTISESQAGSDVLLNQGVNSEYIHLEENSCNTLENLRNARDRLSGVAPDHIALISNRYHLARCHTLAHGLGMRPRLCAAEEQFTPSLCIGSRMLLEAYYLHWYHTGRVWSQLTGNRHSLARIR